MIGLDCNILVQLAIADHPGNSRTISAVQREVEKGSRLVFPMMIATEFLHVVTDDRRFTPPLSMLQAIEWLESFQKNTSVSLLSPNEDTASQTFAWMRQYALGRKRILDTYLAAILYTNGVKRLLTSNPADFKVFEPLELIVP